MVAAIIARGSYSRRSSPDKRILTSGLLSTNAINIRLADPRFDSLSEFLKHRLTLACSWLCELSTVVLELDACFSFRQNNPLLWYSTDGIGEWASVRYTSDSLNNDADAITSRRALEVDHGFNEINKHTLSFMNRDYEIDFNTPVTDQWGWCNISTWS